MPPSPQPICQLYETGDQHLVLFSLYIKIWRRIGEGIMLERMWVSSVRNHPAVPFKLQLPFTLWAAEVFRMFRNQQVLNLCMQRQMLKSSWTVEQWEKPSQIRGLGRVLHHNQHRWPGPPSGCFQRWASRWRSWDFRFHKASTLPFISCASFC